MEKVISKSVEEGVPWWASGQDSALSLLWPWIQSLVREPRSHKTYSAAKKKKMGQGQGEQQIYEWEKLGLKKKYCDNTGTFYYRNK